MLSSGAKRFISPPVHHTPRQHKLYGTPGWTRTSVYRFRRAMPESSRPQARSQLQNVGTGVEDRTLLHLFVGEGLSTRKRPRHFWLWGQDSNLRINWVTASCLAT